MKNIISNFFYQALFQVTKIIIPIITIPIVSNALGPKGIGVYNYTFSVTSYFVLFAGLGVTIYGNRQISLIWNTDSEGISKVFWEITIFKTIITFITLTIYLLFILFVGYRSFFLIQTFMVISVLFDISWFFMGLEDFKKTSLTNLIVQIISFFLIVFFIKDESDSIKYTAIQSVSIFLSQCLVWSFIPKYIKLTRVTFNGIWGHFKGSLQFFIPQIAISLYTNLNKTLLGIFVGNVAVGYFTNSLQLNNVFITIITTIDMVLLPYMTGLFAKNNTQKIVRTMETTIHLQLFFSIPIMFGMLTVYDKLVPWFFGNKFLFINNVIPLFSILIVIIPLGMSISRQYLLPIGKVNLYNKSVIIGAVINLLSNLILIPILGFFGVVIANIISEVFVTVIRTKDFIKNTNFKFQYSKIFKFFISAFIMLLITRMISNQFEASLITNLIQISVAIPTYFIVTSILKANPFIDIINKKLSNK